MLKVLLAVITIYGVLLLATYLGQSRMLYLPTVPSRELSATPQDAGMAYDEVRLLTADDVELHGWYIPAAKPRGTLLFFHGNAGNISHRLDSLLIFHQLGLNVLIFDYRGYGQSGGKPSEAGMQLDALAAWHYLITVRKAPPHRTVLFGRSLGGALAAWLAAHEKPGALVLESAFISVPELAAELYWWFPARWLTRLHYTTRDYLKAVQVPTLVIHSTEDEIIPFRHGVSLYEAAQPPRTFLQLQGDHNRGFLLSRAAYVQGLDLFLTEHLQSLQIAGRFDDHR